MLPRPLIRRIRHLHLRARRAVEDWLGGAYRSVFKGVGIAFEEVREYQPGDDVRGIDWNVTARMGAPFIKRYIEERQQTVMLVVDIGPGMDFGSGVLSKRQVAVEMAALVAMAALTNNDRVGLMLFDRNQTKIIPPRLGTRHALRLLRDLLVEPTELAIPASKNKPLACATGSVTPLARALERVRRILHRRAIVVLFSDFLCQGLTKALHLAAARHDVIAIRPSDAWERALPNVGLIRTADPETGETMLLDTADPAFRGVFENAQRARAESLIQMARKARIDWIDVDTQGNHLDVLQKFFRMRVRRPGRA